MIKIYGKDNCPWCQKTKEFLDSKGTPYQYLTLNVDYMREELLREIPEAKTLPQVVVDGVPIGGYPELVNRWEQIHGQVSGNQEFLQESKHE